VPAATTKRTKTSRQVPDPKYDGEIKAFIAAYPAGLRPEWSRATKNFIAARTRGVSARELTDGAAAYAVAVAHDRTPAQYVRRPANWLRDEGWRDYSTASVATAPRSGSISPAFTLSKPGARA
jgi:hypothetical protein